MGDRLLLLSASATILVSVIVLFSFRRRQRESKLLLGILDALPETVFVKRKNRKHLFVNKAFVRFTGQEREAVIGKTDKDFFTQSRAETYWQQDDQVIDQLKTLECPETVTNSSNEIRVVSTKKVPLILESGEVVVVGIIHDITDKVRTEKLLEEQNQKMIFASKMSALGEMAGNIAHEINNPLSVISGRVGQLLRFLEDGPVEVRVMKDNLTKVENTAFRIARIIRGLRSFSRNGENDPFIDTKIHILVEDMLELCYERFRDQQIQIKTITESPSLSIFCRPVQVGQVLLNLMNNSYDALLSLREKWVEIEMKDLGSNIELSVTDSGLGIPRSIIPQLMQPYFTTKEAGQGTGLGLSISRLIIEEHRGHFFYDESSKNTRFVIQLPKSSSQSP